MEKLGLRKSSDTKVWEAFRVNEVSSKGFAVRQKFQAGKRFDGRWKIAKRQISRQKWSKRTLFLSPKYFLSPKGF